jgi:hypothetical protein
LCVPRGDADANFEGGQVMPDIGRFCARQYQRGSVEVESVDHHQIVIEAEIFNREPFGVDQMAVA